MGMNVKFQFFFVFCNVGFFSTLRSDNLLLKVLSFVRILSPSEYRMMMSVRQHLCA